MRSAEQGAARQLAVLALAMVLGMAPWFSATAVAPALVATWHASPRVAAWLTMAVQLGFVAGTLVAALLVLADRWSARRLAAASALLAACATAALALSSRGAGSALLLRGLTGFALAGVYPPGMKLVAGWWQARRGMAIGVLIGALTLGSASPNLVRVLVDPTNWRAVLAVAALSSAAAGVIFWRFAREGPYQAPTAPFHPGVVRRIVANRGVLLATAGYLGHMWELYAMWSTIGLFWLAVAARRGLSPDSASMLAFSTIAVGFIGCVVAGVYADRVGRATVTIVAMAVSGACALGIGLVIDSPLPLLAAVAALWGVAVIADSAQFSACVTELAPREYVGTALTLQTSLGFLLTLVTIRLVPLWAEAWGWERAYMPLAIGPALGIAAMWRLRGKRSVGAEKAADDASAPLGRSR